MAEEIVVLVTCPAADGLKIARPLVQEELAACVNIVPGLTSVFRWEGAVSEESEQLLIIKSNRASWDGLQKRLKELHSYDTPEMLSFAVKDGYKPYLDWLNASLKQ
jgi:periplasmic divalent cation tolerance protein